MKKLFFVNRIYFLFLFISFLCLAGVVGIDNISFQSTKWLHYNNESSLYQLGWHFFKNDIWRFPLGNNPNYGDGLGSSIVYTDSIPILAIFFKLLKGFIPGNFQYFSFWYFICFYLQLFFSFKILNKFTNSEIYSLIGSIFFLIAPFFIHKVNIHAALAGQWILLCTLYLGLTHKIEKSKWLWIFLIVLSWLINYSFALIILTIYSLLRIFNLKLEKEKIFELIKDFLSIGLLLLLTLYIVGYFEIRMVDTLGVGFGYYKLNLLSIFDSTDSVLHDSWSWFLPDIKLSKGEELEGFNYFGLGQIMMLLFAFILFFNKNYKTNLFSIKNNKEIKAFALISIFLTLWALSNKISLGPYTLLEIPLGKYIFAALSIAKNTGRMFWIVNYLLLILSILIIFKCFNKKNSLLIITLFLIIQIADTSAGIKSRLIPFTNSNENIHLKDQIWDDLFNKYKVLKTTYPKSWSGLFLRFTYAMEKYNIEKTNLVVLARANRKAVAEVRYNLYDNLRRKNLASNTVYIVDNLGHLRHLKYLLENENVGFFYRDNIWSMVMNEKERMNDNDKKIFSGIKPKLLVMKKMENLNLRDSDSYFGFGWSHNLDKPGIWSDGSISTLLFRTEKNHLDLKLEIFCNPYITKKNKILELDIYVNDSFNKKMKLTNNNQEEKIDILIKKELVKDNVIKIDFNFKNPVSPYEVFESPDSRKLGILIKNIEINSI